MAVKINRTFHLIFNKTKKVKHSKKYLLYRKKWIKNPKSFIVDTYPLHIDIESTNDCNLKCPMCPRLYMKNKVGYMDMKLYKKIIDGIAGKVYAIKLNWRGEPTLHPKLPEMIRYAKQKGVLEILMNSNGTVLNDTLSKEIILAGLDVMIFSFDSMNKKSYEKIRPGAIYEKTIGNIKSFVKIRNELGLKKPTVRLQMVNLRNSAKDVEDFKMFWENIADQISYLDYVKWSDKVQGRYNIMEGFVCASLWQRMVIAWDGAITCVGDTYIEYPIGNINRDSILDVWTCRKMQLMRELHKKGEYNKIEICKKCSMPC